MKRGRKNPADVVANTPQLTVIQGDFANSAATRPDPPPTLTPTQAAIWRSIVNDEPLDYFTTQATRDMLKDYCIVRDRLDETSRIMGEFPSDQAMRNVAGSKHFMRLQRSWEIDSRMAVTLSTKLRLTNQSRYTALSAATANQNTLKGVKPWDWEN